jgi:murein DD-endopeptidase MepM/ murein hydrolase activator NlpD
MTDTLSQPGLSETSSERQVPEVPVLERPGSKETPPAVISGKEARDSVDASLAALEKITGQKVDARMADQLISVIQDPSETKETGQALASVKASSPPSILENLQEWFGAILATFKETFGGLFKGSQDEVEKVIEEKSVEWANKAYVPEHPDAPVFSFPKGVKGRVSSGFGPRTPPKTKDGYGSSEHKGYDIPVPEGTPILFTGEKAKVKAVRTQRDQNGNISGGGHYLVLEQADGTELYFMHLKDPPSLHAEDEVASGDVLALTGDSGNSSGPHLHYEVRQNAIAVNPEAYLDEAFHV